MQLLANGKQQFIDGSGAPLASGKVYFYAPATLTPSTTYQDAAGTIPNTNPVNLDSLGQAVIWGNGTYRQIVKDAGGTQIWDQIVSTPDLNAPLASFSGIAGSALIGFQAAGAGAVPRTVQDKLRDTLAISDFGGNSDTAFASTIAAIGLAPRTLDMGGKTSTLTTTPTNTYGVTIENGKVLVPSLIAGQKTQLNSYAPDINGLMVGRENLAYFWKFLSLDSPFKVYFYGDSTVELGPGWPIKSHELFQMALQDAGVNNSVVYNRGVSGTAWSDLNAIPDLSSSTYLLIIKYGINDAVKANPLQTMAADMRAKLSAIRAATNGGLTSVSILLMGPNSTYSPTAGQDAKWYEDVRKLYVQVAQEYDCAYFDTYAYLQQTKRAPGFWMDDLTSLGKPGEGLHPDQLAVYWIYRAALKDHVLGDGGWNSKKANTFWNLTNYTKAAIAADFPNSYQRGITMQAAFTANGWPLSGVVKTELYADGTAVQTVSTVDAVPRTATRRGTAGTWTQWAGVPVPITAFTNSWAAKGGGYADPGYQVQSDGFIELYGHIASGGTGTTAFTLPANARPANANVFKAPKTATVNVFADGTVTIDTTDNTLVGLSGIRFKAL